MTPPLTWHGGKHYLAPKIVALMPPHTHYVEPFAGGLSVLLAKNPEGVSEVANDVNYLLMNFWGCLANPKLFELLRRKAEATPFSQAMWEAASHVVDECMAMGCGHFLAMPDRAKAQVAHAFLVTCRQSLAGRMDAFAPLSKTRTRRGMNEQVSAWLGAVEGLAEVHDRIKRVVLFCDEAEKVILAEDDPHTLFYCDPPYLQETRCNPRVYAWEMDAKAHQSLLETLGTVGGKFLLSGYRSPLYDEYAARKGWNRHDFDLPNNAACGDTKRRMTESVWCNF